MHCNIAGVSPVQQTLHEASQPRFALSIMLIHETDDLPDVFQDGNSPGVKELFNAFEEELLPVCEQLKRYKKRDLYSSHFYRTSCKVFGPRKNIRRLHYVDGNPFSDLESKQSSNTETQQQNDDIELPPYYATEQFKSKPVKEEPKNSLNAEEDSYSAWLKERKQLRKGLDNLGLSISWLERKPERTILEDRVLSKLKENNLPRKALEKEHAPNIDDLHIPLPPTSVMQTLKKIAEHITQNRALLNVFGNTETNRVTLLQCKDGLARLQQSLALSDEAIAEVLEYFYEDEDSSEVFFITLMKSIKSNFSTCATSASDSVHKIKEEQQLDFDKHDSEIFSKRNSTAEALAIRRGSRMVEFNETRRICEKKNVRLPEFLLRKVLLHPGDEGSENGAGRKFTIRQPGEMLSENFWKTESKKRTRKKKINGVKQAGKKQSVDKNWDADSDYGSIREDDSRSFTESTSASKESLISFRDPSEQQINAEVAMNPTMLDVLPKYSEIKDPYSNNEENTFSESQMPKPLNIDNIQTPFSKSREALLMLNHQEQKLDLLTKRQKNSSSPDSVSTDDRSSKKYDDSLIFFPPLRDVLPERHQMNLSTGRAVVARKVDCWLSLEEFEKMKRSSVDLPLRRERSNPNAFWTGHPLHKMRLWMTPCDSHPLPGCDKSRSKRSVFHQVKTLPHNGHRSNYGYDNNELTWPINRGHVKYGDVDQDKVYHI